MEYNNKPIHKMTKAELEAAHTDVEAHRAADGIITRYAKKDPHFLNAVGDLLKQEATRLNPSAVQSQDNNNDGETLENELTALMRKYNR